MPQTAFTVSLYPVTICESELRKPIRNGVYIVLSLLVTILLPFSDISAFAPQKLFQNIGSKPKQYEKKPSSCGIINSQRLCGMVGRSPGQSVWSFIHA
jgi:hypothetical protein